MNRTAHRWQGALVLHRPFLEHAERRPDAPAVIAAGGSLTYAELLGRARSLAGSLRAEGLRPGEPVIVAIDKSLEQVVAATGVLLAGSPYVPVAPGLPAARRQLLVAQTGARHVLVADTAVRASDWPRPLCLLAVPAGGAADGDVAIDEDALAYVIFTSGSTGTPKGVMVQHRAALNTVLDVNRRIALGPRDRALALSELSFDLSVYDVFGVLAAGGVVVMPEPHEMKNAAAWLERIARHEVTILNAVPALVQLLVSYAEARAVPLPRSLRAVLLSGDWIPVGLPDRIRALAPGCDVIGLGGATEASIWSVVYPIARVDPQWRSIPYGRPLANQTIHVLHPDLRDCPDWVPGELFIGGDGLAAGYWRDPERTRASFLVHPDTGERLYRTGDRARHLPDGNVEFLGRTDHQIKLNGYRIELGEIESMLRAHAEVAAAVVAVRSDGAGNRRLVGFVAPPEGCACDSGELRRFLSRQLPAYMVPSAIVTLPEIPLSGNGKIDRAALPDPWQGESARLGESGS
jgi:amino acid adenylation domain-containing protein